MEQEMLEILSQEGVKWAGKKVICLDSVDSTNEYARKLAGESIQQDMWRFSDFLTARMFTILRASRPWTLPG